MVHAVDGRIVQQIETVNTSASVRYIIGHRVEEQIGTGEWRVRPGISDTGSYATVTEGQAALPRITELWSEPWVVPTRDRITFARGTDFKIYRVTEIITETFEEVNE